jgi:hypothetical protein
VSDGHYDFFRAPRRMTAKLVPNNSILPGSGVVLTTGGGSGTSENVAEVASTLVALYSQNVQALVA